MSKKIHKSVEALRKIAPRLNEANAAADNVVTQVEKFLNEECSIGLPCWILADKLEINGDHCPQHLWLGYDRVNGRFRIMVERLVETAGKQENLGPQPWTDCPRDVKLTTLTKLPRLLEHIAEEAKKVAVKNDEVVEAVNDILGAMSN